MSVCVNIHNVSSVSVTLPKLHEQESGMAFWTRRMFVYSTDGDVQEITLFADSREHLLFEEDSR
jgi:hypothetical protein